MGEIPKNAYINSKLAQVVQDLAELRPRLSPQGIAKLIQLQAGVKELEYFIKPQVVVDDSIAERGVYPHQ